MSMAGNWIISRTYQKSAERPPCPGYPRRPQKQESEVCFRREGALSLFEAAGTRRVGTAALVLVSGAGRLCANPPGSRTRRRAAARGSRDLRTASVPWRGARLARPARVRKDEDVGEAQASRSSVDGAGHGDVQRNGSSVGSASIAPAL